MNDFSIYCIEETEYKWIFEVGLDNYRYIVDLDKGYFANLADKGTSPEVLIRASFEFLLEREPASSILSNFELSIIQNYFPEYEDMMRNKLKSR